MPGHYNGGDASMTQNQGNVLGDRPCVRQSKLYRQHVGGNEMKGLLGQETLKWDVNKLQGGYEGQRVHDPLNDKPTNIQETKAKEEPVAARGRGLANRQTYNLITGKPNA